MSNLELLRSNRRWAVSSDDGTILHTLAPVHAGRAHWVVMDESNLRPRRYTSFELAYSALRKLGPVEPYECIDGLWIKA